MTQMHKVQIEGWIVKNENDRDVSEWDIQHLISNMVGCTVQSTVIDSLKTTSGTTNIQTVAPVVQTPPTPPTTTVVSENISSNETMDVSINSDEEGTFNGI